RDFLSRYGDRTVEASRAFIDDMSGMVGSQLSTIAASAGDLLKTGWQSIKENWAPVIVVLGAAKEAFEYFEIGKKVYDKFTSWGKRSSSQATEDEQNLEVNSAIAGNAALEAADRKIEDLPPGKILNANHKDILWISDQLHRKLNENAGRMPEDQAGQAESCQIDVDILLRKPEINARSIRLSQIRLEIDSTTDKLRPDWDDSAFS
ncbi:unnamed protein product, partial [Laminaria digitata]